MGALYVDRHEAASSRPLDTKWRPSGTKPDDTYRDFKHLTDESFRLRHTMPMLRSTVAILLLAPGFSSLLLTIFSTASTTPSLHLIPMEVPPFSTALMAYSTCQLT